MHQISDPGYLMDSEFPAGLKKCLYEADGMSLYFEAITIFSSKEIKRTEDGHWYIGHYNHEIFCDDKGLVFSKEEDFYVQEGKDLETFIYGTADAEKTLYGKDGEFKEGLFDDNGELLLDNAIAYETKKIERDKRALGPMWRLANLYVVQKNISKAQELLEECVDVAPDFCWAWHDLSEISADLGKYELAIDELNEAASQTDQNYLKGHFYSKAAVHGLRNNDEKNRIKYATMTIEHDKDFVNQLIKSVKEELQKGGDIDIERTKEILLAVAPRNIIALDFIKNHT